MDGALVSEDRRRRHCSADFWRLPPPALIHLCAYRALHSCARSFLAISAPFKYDAAVSGIGYHQFNRMFPI